MGGGLGPGPMGLGPRPRPKDQAQWPRPKGSRANGPRVCIILVRRMIILLADGIIRMIILLV